MMKYDSDPIRSIWLLFALVLGVAGVLPAQAPSVEKVEPPNWWAGH